MSLIKKKQTEVSTPAVEKTNFRPKTRKGAFSAGVVALAVAVTVVFNLLIAQIPASKAQIDLTDTKIYNVTDTSVNYLNAMTEDVQIHVLAKQEQIDSRIVRFLEKYTSLSDRLSLEYIDPAVYPSVLSKYGAEPNTVVVTCEATGRQEIIRIDEMIGFDQMAYYMNQEMVETTFDAEGRITSAIDGVLTDARHTAYTTSGHDEADLSETVSESLDKIHMALKSVNLLTNGGIPEDCDLLILNAPARDFADDELKNLQDYLASGGQVIYCMSSELNGLPNLNALCADYGLTLVPGLIADTQRYYQNKPFLFFPIPDSSVDAAAGLDEEATILFYASHGMTVSDPKRDTITVQPFLSTSESGVAVKDDNSQVPGTYVVGAVATEDVDDGMTARLTVFGADSLTNSTITSGFPNVDNNRLFLGCVTAGFQDVSPISVDPVSLAEETNTVTTGGIWGLLFIFVIPIALLIFGFVRWTRRRKL